MFRVSWKKVFLAWILIQICSLAAGASRYASLPPEFLGAWKRDDGALLKIEPQRLLVYDGQRLTVRSVLRFEKGSAFLRKSGLKEVWGLERHQEVLSIKRGEHGQEEIYRPLSEAPPDVRLEPFPLGKTLPLSRERIQELQADLARRMATDQEIRKAYPRSEKVEAVEAENARFLRDLVRQIGWIDVERFGMDASCDAAIIAQHRADLSLMLAALPILERELKGNPEGTQVYAVFFDRLQIDLGFPQRYGTQVGMDEKGNPLVLPLESRTDLERYRKEIGLPPMAEYLKLAGQYLYPGKVIRFADDL